MEDTTVQLSWGDLGPGTHRLTVGGRSVDHAGAGAGTALFEGLAPGTSHRVTVDGHRAGRATTLTAPPGAELSRVATVSDCHLFEDGFGALHKMTEGPDVEHYTQRCLRAALDAAVRWGARLVVVKGDLTQRARPWEVEAAATELERCGLPVVLVPGNHEVKRDAPPWADRMRRAGFLVADRASGPAVVVTDVPGLRVVAVDSTVHAHHTGRLDPITDEILDAVIGSDSPVLLCLHHQLEPAPIRLHYPPGIGHAEGERFLHRLATVRPDVWVTNGHTHRCRSRRHGPVIATEVGSTKDGAGCWAGYAVHEGGMRQVARRVTGDGTDAWLDRSGRAVGGLWGLYAPGRLGDRCLSHTWPTR